MSALAPGRLRIERVPWEEYKRWLRRHVRAGEHAILIGSTGSGKSVLAREVLPMFGRNVVILDGKGGDDPSLNVPGFQTIRSWPPKAEGQLLRSLYPAKGREPIRVRLAPALRDLDRDGVAMRAEFRKCLRDLFTRKNSRVFALYVDEMQIVADPIEGMGLKRYIGPLLRSKRYDGMSVITATQYPAWIGPSAYRETRHRWFFPIDDEDSQKKLAQITGQRATILPVLGTLRPFEFLYQRTRPTEFYISKVPKDLARR